MNKFRLKLKNLWKSRTHWAGVFMGMLVAIQPQLMSWLNYKLAPEDFAMAGLVIVGVISTLRMLTSNDLSEK